MMTDGAACRGAEHAVVAGEMTGDATDSCALDAAFRLSRRGRDRK